VAAVDKLAAAARVAREVARYFALALGRYLVDGYALGHLDVELEREQQLIAARVVAAAGDQAEARNEA